MSGGLGNYDAWKLRSPYDDWDEEPEFHCEECNDTGFMADGDRVELCHCQRERTEDDLIELLLDEPTHPKEHASD